MKLNEILLIGGALVAALVLSKDRKLSSAYTLPQITNPVTNIITKVKSEPVQKTTSLLENILPAPIPAPTPDPIIIPAPAPIEPPPSDYSRGRTSWSVNLGRSVYISPEGEQRFFSKNVGSEEAKLIGGLSRYARGLPEESV